MDYNEVLNNLDNLGKFGIKLGMERIEALLEKLGHPERLLRVVHIAGTNGKGSVSSMIDSVLGSAGMKTGKFTSPHLVKYNERIALNGREIDDAVFAAVLTQALAAAAEVKEETGEQPTEFEVLTAGAFLLFAAERVDYAVIEVGLGGLWDSTNCLVPVVSVITNVALDHTDKLGHTLTEIAGQKAGIIKAGVPVVTAAGGEALEVILSTAKQLGAPVYAYGLDFYSEALSGDMEGQEFLYHDDGGSSIYRVPLAGKHQAINAAVAVKALKLLPPETLKLDEGIIREGLAKTKWPGRLELIGRNPDIILDGAHNPAGAEVLRQALDQCYPGLPVSFVFGMMADKDVEQVIELLFKEDDHIFTVAADNSARAASPAKLAQLCGKNARAIGDVTAAYALAVETAGTQGVVCVCGSLYLLGTFLRGQRAE